MNTQYNLIPFQEANFNESIDLYIDTFTKEPWNDIYDSREQVEAFFKNYLEDNYFLGYALLNGNKMVALAIGAKKPWIKGMEYYIDQFCVSYELQGKGIGSIFLNLIEKDIENKNLNAIYLTTDKGFPSEKFYLKNGFEVLEEIIVLAK